MQKIRFALIVALLILTYVAVVSYFFPLPYFFLSRIESVKIVAEATRYPLKLRITLERASYKLGEPVDITWCLMNIGDENITVNGRAIPDFIVYNLFKNKVYGYDEGIVMEVWFLPIIVPPGCNVTTRLKWYQKVSPGIYYIAGVFQNRTYGQLLQQQPYSIETQAMMISIAHLQWIVDLLWKIALLEFAIIAIMFVAGKYRIAVRKPPIPRLPSLEEELYGKMLGGYRMCYGKIGKLFLEKRMDTYIKQGFSREEAVRKVSKDEGID